MQSYDGGGAAAGALRFLNIGFWKSLVAHVTVFRNMCLLCEGELWYNYKYICLSFGLMALTSESLKLGRQYLARKRTINIPKKSGKLLFLSE